MTAWPTWWPERPIRCSATAIARGDPGKLGLFGPATPPEAVKPQTLIVLESAGWAKTDDATRSAFEALLESAAAKFDLKIDASKFTSAVSVTVVRADGEWARIFIKKVQFLDRPGEPRLIATI